MKIIFLIDDDFEDKEIFENALETLLVRTNLIYAKNGEEALLVAERNHSAVPDYIFLDLNMPKMNGAAFLQELRARGLYHGIPVYIYSTSSGGADVTQCLNLGALPFTKPYSFSELCAGLAARIV